jgi:hypothetical protein
MLSRLGPRGSDWKISIFLFLVVLYYKIIFPHQRRHRISHLAPGGYFRVGTKQMPCWIRRTQYKIFIVNLIDLGAIMDLTLELHFVR